MTVDKFAGLVALGFYNMMILDTILTISNVGQFLFFVGMMYLNVVFVKIYLQSLNKKNK